MKTNIKLTQSPYVEGYAGAFYRYTTDEGKPSACGIWDNWYTAEAVDENGKHYSLVWTISNMDALQAGDEDCCDWDNPAEVLDEDGNVVTNEINIIC